MQITWTADYALRAVVHLAEHAGEGLVPAAVIARRESIPREYVAKVLRALSRAGIVSSLRGRGGGARLLREPRRLSVLEVVEAVDGPVALNRCLIRPGTCPRDDDCKVHRFWARTQRQLVAAMSRAKISQFCTGAAAPGRRGRGRPKP
jgi:Rrf2 family protein